MIDDIKHPDLTQLAEQIEGAVNPKELKCPHCDKPFSIENVAHVVPKTVLTMRLESSTGAFSAHTVGHVIAEFDKLLKMIARDVGGKAHVFVDSLERTEKTLSVGFLVTTIKNGHKKRNGTSK